MKKSNQKYERFLNLFLSEVPAKKLYHGNDIFIDKRAQMEEKIAEGRYFCMLYQRTECRCSGRSRRTVRRM